MDYQIRPLGKKCAATGADLVPGTLCYSVLIEDSEGIKRLDYSPQGWKEPPPGVLGVWKCLVPLPTPIKRNLLDLELLLQLFERLSEEANPLQEGLRYVLSLLLTNKRKLHLEGARQEGEDNYFQLVDPQTSAAYEVRDMQLEDSEVDRLQAELNAYLAVEAGELPPESEEMDAA